MMRGRAAKARARRGHDRLGRRGKVVAFYFWDLAGALVGIRWQTGRRRGSAREGTLAGSGRGESKTFGGVNLHEESAPGQEEGKAHT